jgi:hypothetical protein
MKKADENAGEVGRESQKNSEHVNAGLKPRDYMLDSTFA